jgi:hypothetical protein
MIELMDWEMGKLREACGELKTIGRTSICPFGNCKNCKVMFPEIGLGCPCGCVARGELKLKGVIRKVEEVLEKGGIEDA